MGGLFNSLNGQEIIVFFLLFLAILFLIRYFKKQSESHNCDDCALMEMQKNKKHKKSSKEG